MVDRVHGHTTRSRPAVSLDTELVVSTTSLEQRLVDTTTASDDTNGATGGSENGLLGARRQSDSSLAGFRVVTDDGGIVARGPRERTPVTRLLLDVADDGTFRKLRDGKDVADAESGLLAGVDKGTGRETLGSDEGFGLRAVVVGIAENNASEGRASVRWLSFLPHLAKEAQVGRTDPGRERSP